MTEKAWTIKRFFPFGPGREQLDGSQELRGQVGFGTVPDEVCPPRRRDLPVSPGRNTGWSPVIKSLGYVSLQIEAPNQGPTPPPGAAHDLTMSFVENVITEKSLQGSVGGLVQQQRWQQVILRELGIQVAYLVSIPVPVSEESGHPFQLRFVTENRTTPSQVVVEYQWGRFVRDTSAAGNRRTMYDLLEDARGLAVRFIEAFRESRG